MYFFNNKNAIHCISTYYNITFSPKTIFTLLQNWTFYSQISQNSVLQPYKNNFTHAHSEEDHWYSLRYRTKTSHPPPHPYTRHISVACLISILFVVIPMQKYKLFLLSKHQLTYKYANPTYTTQKNTLFPPFPLRIIEKWRKNRIFAPKINRKETTKQKKIIKDI